MTRLLIHVEGETEETFVNEVLGPYLYACGYVMGKFPPARPPWRNQTLACSEKGHLEPPHKETQSINSF